MTRRVLAQAAVAIACGLAPVGAHAIAIGTLDTFTDLTIADWFAGGGPVGAVPPVPPFVEPTDGPGGAGDAFMELTAVGGQGPGSRLSVLNAGKWAGNYAAAGVGSIEMDLRNLGASDLVIRLLFEDPIPGPPLNIAVSAGVTLPAGGGWVHESFDLGDLTAVLGSVTPLLTNTTVIRIIHAPAATLPEPVAGVLGVDNILAVAGPLPVDEPTSAWLACGALLALALLRSRRPASTPD